MRLILHIGTRKTGSSSLQRTLGANASQLERSGILYPRVPHLGGKQRPNPAFEPHKHGVLEALVAREPARRLWFSLDVDGDLASLRRVAAAAWDQIVDHVRSTGAETVILSSEDLFYLTASEVTALRDLLVHLTDEIQVVAYVRPPASYYLSRQQSMAVRWPSSQPPARFRARFRDRLTRFCEAFRDRIQVRSCERSALLDGDIVQDFLVRVVADSRLDLTDLEVRHRNVSPSAEASCILQDLRRYGLPQQDGLRSPTSIHVLQTLETMAERSPQTRARLKPGIAGRINGRHREDVDWLRDRFGVSFKELDIVEDDPRNPPEGWKSDRLINILDVEPAKVSATLFELLDELSRRVMDHDRTTPA